MNYGLYLSAGGALSSLHRQDVITNNLANLNTVGFKPDSVEFRTRLAERLESGAAFTEPQLILEQLGGGPGAQPTRINFVQGGLTKTGNDLDLALEGDGFFVVHTGRDAGNDSLRFTRDGRFTLNAAGELVMSATGMRVLDHEDQPIRLDRSATVQIDADGQILQNGAPVARLQIATVDDTRSLMKEGASLLRFKPGVANLAVRQPATAAVRQNHLENSAVDPIMALNAMIDASKAVSANATMMQYHDNVMGQVINTFARVG